MQRIKTLFLLIALLASFSFGAAWTGANSEPESTQTIDGKKFYVITTPEELAWVAKQVNAGYDKMNAVLANDIVFGEDTASVNTEYAWTPIGKDGAHAFKGILDGAGYSIYGVWTDSTIEYAGLVGILGSAGVVRNVNMKRDSINATEYAGGVVGWNSGTVSDCANSGNVSATGFSRSSAGGIVGYNSGTVSDCANEGSVSATGSNSSYAGGIVGYNAGGTVSGCTNSGSVSATYTYSSSYSYAGGIVGYNKAGTVKNSYSYMNSLRGNYKGGVAGGNVNEAKIINCYYDSDELPGVSAIGSNSATATDVAAMTTANMQRDQFAWILNTTNGSEENSGVWSRNGGYPIFANAENKAIYRVVFNDDGATTNRYTDYRGLVAFPSDPEPTEGYMFSGWYDAKNVKVKTSTVFSADQMLNAVYIEATDVYFTIRFFNADSSRLDSQSVQYGKTPTYSGIPTLPKTAEFSYVFAGWHVEPTAATEDFDYYATYTKTTNSYTVTFLDFDGTKLQESSYLYGATPGYAKTPKRTSTTVYDYTFAGWTPAVVKVIADAEYKAVYDSSLVKYTVTFMNGSDVFETQRVSYGTAAVTPNPAPTRDGYKFIGWTPGYTKITGNLTVSALFEELILRSVFIYDDDGEIVDTVTVEDSEKYVLPEAPEKKGHDFVGWYDGDTFVGNSGDTLTISTDISLEARYEVKSYTITFKNGTTTLHSGTLRYGEIPTYTGATPKKPSTAKYNYTFKGWSPSIVPVSGTATYMAAFDSTLNLYKVVFYDYDGAVLTEGWVTYGDRAIAPDVPPRKGYDFVGWDAKFDNVVSDMNVTAIYKALSSSSIAGSSSSALSSSSAANPSSSASSSSSVAGSSSSSGSTSLHVTAQPRFNLQVQNRTIWVQNARMGESFAVFDVQGHVLRRGVVNSTELFLSVQNAGAYIVRVGTETMRVRVK